MHRSFLAHYICTEQGVFEQSILRIEGTARQISVSPYEKETSDTRFCDGVLLATNSLFQTKKQEILDALNEREYDSLHDVAHALSMSPYLSEVLTPPLTSLYSLYFDARTHRLYWQVVALL